MLTRYNILQFDANGHMAKDRYHQINTSAFPNSLMPSIRLDQWPRYIPTYQGLTGFAYFQAAQAKKYES